MTLKEETIDKVIELLPVCCVCNGRKTKRVGPCQDGMFYRIECDCVKHNVKNEGLTAPKETQNGN